nr:MAG TPA: hypothetical protein [Caudoviricetes sp.]
MSSRLTFLIKLYQSWREKSSRWVGLTEMSKFGILIWVIFIQ